MANKILLIRMLGLGDVISIGIPALRYFKAQNPNAELHMLTYSVGKEVINLAMPEVKVQVLEKGQWPEDIVGAMQTFLGLAEEILSNEYSKIVNLDTWFMPCFLTRFLKDAGEPVAGNFLSKSIPELVDSIQNKSLSAEYVNQPKFYMDSTWPNMNLWHTPWWDTQTPLDHGYPEFYLKRCCEFSDLNYSLEIDIPHVPVSQSNSKLLVALNSSARTAERNYPYSEELKASLEAEGVEVWQGFDGSVPLVETLTKLKASQLLITVPSAPQWLAKSVGTSSLIISGKVDPRTLSPEYATDMSEVPIEPSVLTAGVLAILKG